MALPDRRQRRLLDEAVAIGALPCDGADGPGAHAGFAIVCPDAPQGQLVRFTALAPVGRTSGGGDRVGLEGETGARERISGRHSNGPAGASCAAGLLSGLGSRSPQANGECRS